jgi:hypothetical protein
MKFTCQEISISNEEFGCTIFLSDTMEEYEFEKEQSNHEIIESLCQYIMIQKTYAEDEFEEDYYYFETSDHDKSGELNEFEITLSENNFIFKTENDTYEIEINANEEEFNELKEALKTITYHKGKLILT